MKIFGIIMEANPFHLGHEYFIKKVKETYEPDVLIAITSTSFTMRGDISIVDKFSKINLLLNAGVDLVFELPFSLAVQSADFFSKNAIDILNVLEITDLAFGSETENINLYKRLYNALKRKPINYETLKTKSKKVALTEHLHTLRFRKDEIELINMPNFTLGYQYIKNILDNEYPIEPHLIKRVANNYNDLIPTSTIASATAIRNLHQKGISIQNYISYDHSILVNENNSYQKLMPIIDYMYNVFEVQYATYFGQKEGINQYIKKNGNFDSTFDAFVNSLKNKKYSSSLIKRIVLHTLIKTKEEQLDFPYLRMLGATKNGLKYINTLPDDTKNAIFSSPKKAAPKNPLLRYELTATKLYQVITNNDTLFVNEFKLPIRKG